MSKNIIIVGHEYTGKSLEAIKSMQKQYPDCEIITVDEAKERGISISKNEKPEIPLIPNGKLEWIYNKRETRAERRKKDRQKNKKRRK